MHDVSRTVNTQTEPKQVSGWWSVGLALVLVVGGALGLVLAVALDDPKRGFLLGFLPLPTIYAVVYFSLINRPESDETIASRFPLLQALLLVLSALAPVIVFSFFRLFWVLAILGIVGVVAGFRQRHLSTARSNVAFVSVFVALYGILGHLILVLARPPG